MRNLFATRQHQIRHEIKLYDTCLRDRYCACPAQMGGFVDTCEHLREQAAIIRRCRGAAARSRGRRGGVA